MSLPNDLTVGSVPTLNWLMLMLLLLLLLLLLYWDNTRAESDFLRVGHCLCVCGECTAAQLAAHSIFAVVDAAVVVAVVAVVAVGVAFPTRGESGAAGNTPTDTPETRRGDTIC